MEQWNRFCKQTNLNRQTNRCRHEQTFPKIQIENILNIIYLDSFKRHLLYKEFENKKLKKRKIFFFQSSKIGSNREI